MNKKILTLLVVALTITVALYWMTGDTKALVTGDLVNNQEEMTALAQSLLGEENISSEESQALFDKYSSTYGIAVWNTEDSIVQFDAGSEGVAPSSRYWGLYYSPDDVVTGFQGVKGDLTITADGAGWTLSGNDDNGGYVEKVTDNWYYFEAHF